MTPENFPPEFQAVPGRIEVQPSEVAKAKSSSSDKKGLRVLEPGVWISAVTSHWPGFCFCYDLIRFSWAPSHSVFSATKKTETQQPVRSPGLIKIPRDLR